MTEGVNTIVQKKLRNLWIGIGLLFVMIVVLFVILLSSHLFLYDLVVYHNRIIPYMADVTLILLMSAVILSFAVVITAVKLSN